MSAAAYSVGGLNIVSTPVIIPSCSSFSHPYFNGIADRKLIQRKEECELESGGERESMGCKDYGLPLDMPPFFFSL